MKHIVFDLQLSLATAPICQYSMVLFLFFLQAKYNIIRFGLNSLRNGKISGAWDHLFLGTEFYFSSFALSSIKTHPWFLLFSNEPNDQGNNSIITFSLHW